MDSSKNLLDDISTGDPGEGIEERQVNDSFLMIREKNDLKKSRENSESEFMALNTNFGYKQQKIQIGNYVLGIFDHFYPHISEIKSLSRIIYQ